MNFKGLIDKFFKGNSKKIITNMIIIALIGILLILIGDITSGLNPKKKNTDKGTIEVNSNAQVASASTSYEDRIKKDLVDTLSLIAGVGRVSVMIYFESGSESIVAQDTNENNRKIEEKDGQGGNRVTTENTKTQNIITFNESGGSRPFVIKQNNPSIGGVMIVAEGASNPSIMEKIHNTVKIVLNLPAHKVSVLPMKK